MEECKICGIEKKNLPNHVRAAHQMNMAEYDKYESTEEESFGELDEATVMNMKEISESRFGDSIVKSIAEKPLSVFLKKYDIAEKELIDVVKSYKGLGSVKVTQSIKENTSRGSQAAQELNDEFEKSGDKLLEVTDLYVAEALIKSYNFKCDKVVGKTLKNPKTWVLSK